MAAALAVKTRPLGSSRERRFPASAGPERAHRYHHVARAAPEKLINPAAGSGRTRKGWAVTGPKGALQQWQYEARPLGPQEVDIRVTHNGLCHTDLHMRDDDWKISGYPFIPGHEVVGTIAALGEQVKELRVGQRVGVGWIKDSCRRCRNCLRGEENLCLKGYTGLIVKGGLGGFQDVMRASADFVYPLPEGLDSADAAPLLCAGITVYAPLKRHIAAPGQRVAVLGIGGLGHLALQFAAAMGGVVTALDLDAGKHQQALAFGAQRFVQFQPTADSSSSSTVTEEDEGYDVLINCASGAVEASRLLSMLKPDGTLVQVGIPGGETMKLPLQDLVFSQKRVAGSIVGGRADMVEMLQLAAAKGIRPLIERWPLADVNKAMAHLAAGRARYRVVLISSDA